MRLSPAMTAITAIRGRLALGEAGQVTIEWALVLAAFALPMYFVLRLCMAVLVAHYQMTSFLVTGPFP